MYKGLKKNKFGGDLLSQLMLLPSALWGLTTLFGKGRGEHPRSSHHKILKDDKKAIRK